MTAVPFVESSYSGVETRCRRCGGSMALRFTPGGFECSDRVVCDQMAKVTRG